MRGDKNIALDLRREGKAYKEISKKLNIPKSTLSGWFSNIGWSEDLKNDLTKKANRTSQERFKLYNEKRKKEWEKWREAAREEARKDFNNLKKNPLFVAGLMLYWAEGDSKIKNPFRLSNTDPRMISLYVKFLTQVLNISKSNIRPTIILYPDLSEKKSIEFWSKIIGVPKSQFYKTQFIKGKHPTKRLSSGICMIMCGNRQIKEKVMVWIDLLSKTL